MVNRLTMSRRAFSLIELVVVVVIIGIIGAIAIPRMSKGASGASESSLSGNLSVLRNAIALYEAEHQAYPAVATFSAQMLQYTDASGNTNATKTSTYQYGPYLRSIPALPVGANKGSNTVAASYAANVGWVYDVTTGTIIAGTSATEVDSVGTKYNTY